MAVSTRQVGGVLVVDLEGPMNLHSLRGLNTHFEGWAKDGLLNLVFNMQDVTLISSSGLGALIGFSQELKKLKGRLVLASMHQSGREVMAITKLDTLFHIYDTVDEAVASFSN